VGSPRYPEDAHHWPVDLRLAESDSFFGERGVVHKTLRTLADRLREEAIPFAIVGGTFMAIGARPWTWMF
jgi:hypothetical protein